MPEERGRRVGDADHARECEEHAAQPHERGEPEGESTEQAVKRARLGLTRQPWSVEPQSADTLRREHEAEHADEDRARPARVERRMQGSQRHERRTLGDGARASRCRVELRREDENGAAQREEKDERARDEPAPQVQTDDDSSPVRRYWITECGVGVRRVTLIFSRSIIVGTLGEISFFQ